MIKKKILELVRLGIKAATSADITNSISVVASQIEVSTLEGPIWHLYHFYCSGDTASGGDFTGACVDDGNASGAQAMLATMAGAAISGYQIPEQVWGGRTGTGGFTFGQPDNSSTPLMWAMAHFFFQAEDGIRD